MKPTTPMLSKAEHLKAAASLVEQVAATLNTRQKKCTCCGQMSYQNWSETLAHKELVATVAKLRRFAGTL